MIEARIVELLGPRRLSWRREALDVETLPPTQVLCETLASVISPGTELGAYRGLPPLRAVAAYPRLQGYCNVARIVAVGAQAGRFKPGDRVLSFSSHRSHFVIQESDILAIVPVGLPSEEAACAYLFHLGYNAVLRADARAGSRMLVIGVGALGLTSIAMASLAGANVHAISDHAAERARAAGALSAHGRGDIAAARDVLGEAGADVVIVTTDTWQDWALALQHAGMRGTIAVLGFPGRSEAPGDFNPLDSRSFYAKQLRIEAVGYSPERPDDRGFARYNERANLAWILEQMAAGRLRASLLLSARYPAADIQRAYEDLLVRKDSPVTYSLLWRE